MSWVVAGVLLAAASSPPIVHVGVDLVQVDATVTDKRGRQVEGLTAADFQVFEDGKRQEITHCEYVRVGAPVAAPTETHRTSVATAVAETPAPKTVPAVVALVIHDYGLDFANTERVRHSARRFVDAHADGLTRIAITRTGRGTETRPSFTTDRALLHAAVDSLEEPPKERMPTVPEDVGQSRYGPMPGGGNAELMAMWHRRLMLPNLDGLEAVVAAMASLAGRRSVVLFSDQLSLENHDPDMRKSLDPWVMEKMERVRERANRASVVMYTVTTTGLRTFALTASESRPRHNVRAAMSEEAFTGLHVLPEATGGLWLRNTNDLDHALETIAADQAGYYVLAYTPDESFFERKDGRPQFRKLKVKVKRGGVTVRSRSGFLGTPDGEAP